MEVRLSLDHIRRHLNTFQVNEGIQKEACAHDVATALAFIEQHAFDPTFSVKQLKRRCRLKNNNISSRFKLYVGLGIQRYVEKRRIEAAKKLLALDQFGIYHIAVAVGYAHHETFCRAFRRVEGCAPSAYQAEAVALRHRNAA